MRRLPKYPRARWHDIVKDTQLAKVQ